MTSIARNGTERRDRNCVVLVLAYGLLLVVGPAAAANAACDPVELAKFLPPVSQQSYQMGSAVAISGDTALVGACGDSEFGTWSGAAYVFVRSGETWTQQARLVASDGGEHHWFGTAVAIDGDTAVVGAHLSDFLGTYSGSAYIFERDAVDNWTQRAKLLASDGAYGDNFGISVAIDDDTVVVGATGSDAVYVYTRDTLGSWGNELKLAPGNGESAWGLGRGVAIDGDVIVAGAPGNSGAAYVFGRDTSGTWSEQARLTPSDGEQGNRFGWSASTQDDTIVVGATCDFGAGTVTGSAYVFSADGSGSWTEQAKLYATDDVGGYDFGHSVVIDNGTIAVSRLFNSNATAAVCLYMRNALGNWVPQATMTTPVAMDDDCYGTEVALGNDTLVIGALLDDEMGEDTGAAYVYDISLCEPQLPGDCDCDGSADVFDIDAFVMAILFPAEYALTYPQCDVMSADCDGDGRTDVFDIDAFIDLILGE